MIVAPPTLPPADDDDDDDDDEGPIGDPTLEILLRKTGQVQLISTVGNETIASCEQRLQQHGRVGFRSWLKQVGCSRRACKEITAAVADGSDRDAMLAKIERCGDTLFTCDNSSLKYNYASGKWGVDISFTMPEQSDRKVFATKDCWGCGKSAPPRGQPQFKQCSRCLDCDYLPSRAFYCSQQCLLAHWPVHKVWHKEQKQRIEQHEIEQLMRDAERVEGRSEASKMMRHAICEQLQERADSAYQWLNAHGQQQRLEGNLAAAVKQYKKAIWQRPSEPEAYARLGAIYNQTGDHTLAFECHASAYERCWAGSTFRAGSVSNACASRATAAPCGCNDCFCDCSLCSSALPARPSWMATPSAILLVAEDVIIQRPNCQYGWILLGSAQSYVKNHAAAAKAFMKAAAINHRGGKSEAQAARAEETLEKARWELEKLRVEP